MALGDKAQAILASLPAADNKKAQALLGVTLPNERRRLDRIVNETELILDERRVAETNALPEPCTWTLVATPAMVPAGSPS